jgi:hypothetical protein
MSVEPGFVDANVLVYAMDADAPQHAASRALLGAARDLSNARRVPNPRTPGDALRAIFGLLAFLQVLLIPARAVEV